MKLFVFTQVYENDSGEANGRWKSQPGDTYCVANVTYAEAANLGHTGLQALMSARVKALKIECNDEFLQEYVIDWSLEEDNYVTYDERLQLEFDGKVTYPHKDMRQLEARD